MQIVIDIPEDVYTRLFDNGIQDNEIAVDDVCEMARALRLGTPLTKRIEYGTDGNLYEMSITNGKEYECAIKMREATPKELETYRSNRKKIYWLNGNGEKGDELCKTCFHYPEDCKLSSNAICIMCTNPHNSIDHLYYKKKEDSDETIFESNNQR